MDPINYSVLIHAGTTESWSGDAEYQEATEQVLFKIAEQAGNMLGSGVKSVDVVEYAVSELEDCPFFNAGKGAILNEKGKHELEAGILDGSTGAYGAVACVSTIKNPVRAARLIMGTRRHSLLTGAAAVDVASRSGLDIVPNDYFTTTATLARWKAQANQQAEAGGNLESVGAIALDTHGMLAAAGSAGGPTNKSLGRIGDTAIIGAGLFADKDIAVVCSGNGDDILRCSMASQVNCLQQNMPLGEAVRKVITSKARTFPSACAVLALDRRGQSSSQSSGRTFLHASSSASGTQVFCSGPTVPLLPQHVFYQDRILSAGLTRYPASTGHTLLITNPALPLMSLQLPHFVEILTSARRLSPSVCRSVGASRCGLVCDGSFILSLIPLLGLSKVWEPIIHKKEEFHASFPGFLTSKNGPKLNDSELTATQVKILGSTSLQKPFDYSFNGLSADQNLFARIVRGEVPQWRVWEDKKHVAFLTPFGNTPGYTVVIPRKHLSSDVFSLDDSDYTDIITAAYQVAQHLKHAFGVAQCGMFFEGFEIDYAHVKMVPVHDHDVANGRRFSPVPGSIAFQTVYEGFLTTQLGPLAKDLGELAETANGIREFMKNPECLTPPVS
ncbi:MAG: hypothetical protein Q9211_003145 [Gyalolechia sp. 1 TL-2023]